MFHAIRHDRTYELSMISVLAAGYFVWVSIMIFIHDSISIHEENQNTTLGEW